MHWQSDRWVINLITLGNVFIASIITFLMAGCFSWCPGSRRVTTNLKSGVVKVTVASSKQSKQVSATPTTGDYVLEGSAKTVNVLKAAVDVAGGIPGAKGVLELALILIETCQVSS